jgi:hypothetical protein
MAFGGRKISACSAATYFEEATFPVRIRIKSAFESLKYMTFGSRKVSACSAFWKTQEFCDALPFWEDA